MELRTVDAWMQHPTERFLAQPFFESILRWLGRSEAAEIPLASTVAAMPPPQ